MLPFAATSYECRSNFPVRKPPEDCLLLRERTTETLHQGRNVDPFCEAGFHHPPEEARFRHLTRPTDLSEICPFPSRQAQPAPQSNELTHFMIRREPRQ